MSFFDTLLAVNLSDGGGGGGTNVEANPQDEATAELEKLKVGSSTYSVVTKAGVNTALADYMKNVVHPHIYGVKWDWSNSNSPDLTRTDMSEYFVDPSPAVSNGIGSSPFDMLYPWCDMKVVEDIEAGSLVKIPKFWYKMTRDETVNKYTLQIADAPVDGFFVSPTHRDRGDGKGERDIVYVGRYHCDSNYQSKTGALPINNITRGTARDNIHLLGSKIYQYDFLTMWTIRMLYLVEYASFNSQSKIGYGCSANEEMVNSGYTDAMQYHTGTDATDKTTYGGTQYRHIEGLWDNVFDFVDGVYYGQNSTNVILNPNDFGESDGISIGNRAGNGSETYGTNVGNSYWLSSNQNALNIPFSNGVYSDSTYSKYNSDYMYGKPSGVILFTGGSYGRGQQGGLFYENTGQTVDFKHGERGCRLIKLP